jgi:hypothetical protein
MPQPKWDRLSTNQGYQIVHFPSHPDANPAGYVFVHRWVAEQKIGRAIRKGEHVHHINENKQDNRPEKSHGRKCRRARPHSWSEQAPGHGHAQMPAMPEDVRASPWAHEPRCQQIKSADFLLPSVQRRVLSQEAKVSLDWGD